MHVFSIQAPNPRIAAVRNTSSWVQIDDVDGRALVTERGDEFQRIAPDLGVD